MKLQLEIPPELLTYQILLQRSLLSRDEWMQHDRLHQGYVGEKVLEQFIHDVKSDKMIALFDCLFEVNETEFQIDCLLLTSDTVILLEAKHYNGDYFLENEKFFHFKTKREIRSPLLQSERAKYLLKQLLSQLGVNLDVQSYIVFTNKNFHLYGSMPQLPMIFRAQLERFLQKIDANAGGLTDQSHRLARLLSKRKKEQSRYARMPKYNLDEMKRGVFCEGCRGELERENRHQFICMHCDIFYQVSQVILYATATFQILFPKEKITTKTIVEWCGGVLTRKGIRSTLQKHLQYHENGRYSYYTFNSTKEIYRIITREKKH